MKSSNDFLERINRKESIVGVIGLGYVGLPLAITIASKGYKVYGFETDKDKVEKLYLNESYIRDVPKSDIVNLILNKKFTPTIDFNYLNEVDIIVICVPTPLTNKRKPDLSYIEKAIISIKEHLKDGQLIILESTTYPGTTEDITKYMLESNNFKVGENFYVAFSPERIDPSNKEYKVVNTPKVVGGMDESSATLAKTFYENIIDADICLVSDTKTAEMSKILENTYRLVNIALITEFAEMCELLEIDIWEVIKACKTKPYGFQAFYPGPGVGGHCIPIDPIYLVWKMEKENMDIPLVKKADDIVRKIPDNIVKRIKKLLKVKNRKLANSNILLIGVSYKKDTDDLRESPTLKLIDLLLKQRANIAIYDQQVKKINHNNIEYKSVDLESIADYDLVLICVDHSNVDYNYIYNNAKSVIDLKNTISTNEIKKNKSSN